MGLDSDTTEADGILTDNDTSVANIEYFTTDGTQPIDHMTIYLNIQSLCLGIFSLLVNGFVLLIIAKHKPLRNKICQILILHQTIVDAISAAFLVTLTVPDLNVIPTKGLIADIYCRIVGPRLFVWMTYYVSTYNLVLMAFERFLMVVFPMFHRQYFTKRVVMIGMATTWVLGVLFHIPVVTLTSSQVGTQCFNFRFWPSPAVRLLYGILTFLLSYLIPAVVLVYLHAHVALKIWQRNRNKIAPQNQGPRENNTRLATVNRQMSKAQANVTQLTMIVTATFLLCWTPTKVSFFFFNLGLIPQPSAGDWGYLTDFLGNANSFVNPFIYIAQYKEFQKGLRKLIGWRYIDDEADYSFSATAQTANATN